MYDPQYYADRRQKLEQKARNLVQRFINNAFDFVTDSNENVAAMGELQSKEAESQSKKEPKQEVSGQPSVENKEGVASEIKKDEPNKPKN